MTRRSPYALTRPAPTSRGSSVPEASPHPGPEHALPAANRARRLIGSPRRTQGPSSPASRPPGHLWTVEQVAQCCSVSTRTTRRWIEAGVLRAYRLGSLVRISEEFFFY